VTVRNALTFDVEEYFQVEAFASIVSPDAWSAWPSRVVDSTQRVLDLLAVHCVTATFFVLGWVAERHPGLVRAIHAGGHEVASHGYAHRPIHAQTRHAFQEDVRHARHALEDACGAPVLGYRAPTFSVVRRSLWALEVLAAEGFVYDSSIFPIHHDRYGIPDWPRFPHRVPLAGGGDLLEFPITTLEVLGCRLPFCGGGYFRLAPYPLIRAGLRRLHRRDRRPGIVYLHPWELDPEQPRVPAGWLTRVRHSVNIVETAAKLDRLLGDFAFAPVRAVLQDQGLLVEAGR
jgi:polysaccharide deacetylase family protein (PEP-CTERM system associated)